MTYHISMTRKGGSAEIAPSDGAIFIGGHGTPAWRSQRSRSYLHNFEALRRELGDGLAFDYPTAAKFGIPRAVLYHHRRQGRLWPAGRGLFRFEDQGLPSYVESARLVADQLGDDAVASHTTALHLHRCTDLAVGDWEFTVPRSRRYRRRAHLRLHTTTRDLPERDVTVVEQIRVTTLVRTILDATAAIDPYQIEIAVYEGTAAGILDVEELRARMPETGKRRWIIESALHSQRLR